VYNTVNFEWENIYGWIRSSRECSVTEMHVKSFARIQKMFAAPSFCKVGGGLQFLS
jgi:hypothetical protein